MTTEKAGENASKATSKAIKTLDLGAIVQHKFHAREFIKVAHDKHQIILHHTVSGEGVGGDINWWLKDGKRIGTCILIAHDGTIHQVFSSKYWGYHIGNKASDFKRFGLHYKRHDLNSIGIEIDAWGGLVENKETGTWHPAKWSKGKFIANLRVSAIEQVVLYPKKYRGFYAFERYKPEQIESVRQLLVFWGNHYHIPLDYHADMWDVSPKALSSEKGIWSHTSFRFDKSDIHPQDDLIEMLKGLTK